MDTAVAPLKPTNNTAPRILLLAILGGVGAGIGLALLLDMIDRRIRYSEQVHQDLGLVIAGAIPRIPRGGINASSPEQVSGLIEAFRSVRMHVMYTNQLPTAIAISSASPGDGKSLVAANLAMSFADAGFRTVLVDADTRRGALHELFGMPMAPGLTDFLSGTTPFSSVVQATSLDKLAVVSCGRRIRRSPELLTSSLLGVLVNQLRQSYDVVILDTPPLSAGIDAYAVASAAANLLMVVRVGKTDRRMAAAKLLTVDRLPVRILGAVLNGVSLTGEYQYYGYSQGYALPEGEVEPVG
jgi:capsular exopolysaccharide synthesis family protein